VQSARAADSLCDAAGRDLVVVRQQEGVTSGDTVAAVIEGIEPEDRPAISPLPYCGCHP
jgi:hypothetical protein